ncbi:hypothetical protein ABH930_005190, partial [Kitasatospora sp. GAS204A]|uniref:hypothetical protein n=1 Tax=Kitasatospora sp. GAS204B TaxID=3035283 RepID=UPI00247E610E|nr:hypothetical protein [Kitasatospora sp. GAS204B]
MPPAARGRRILAAGFELGSPAFEAGLEAVHPAERESERLHDGPVVRLGALYCIGSVIVTTAN